MSKLPVVIVIIILVISGCQMLNPVPPTPSPMPQTPTPLPPKEINICLGYEPESLYFYNAGSQAARDVMAAIYDGPVDFIDGQPLPVILEKLPSFADGSARFAPVGVNPGDPVVNTEGYLVSLQAGVQVFPTGCTNPTCALTYDGTNPLQMDQTIAIFNIKPGILWSDGQPLTAVDSSFSFNVAADPATPVNKHFVDFTYSYTATDVLTIEWTSQPGLLTNEFHDFFWRPLPEHAWNVLSPDEMLSSYEVNRTPIGWGAFMVNEWVPGVNIQLIRNPNYFRSKEGLPQVDILNYRFIDPREAEDISQLANGRCDIVSNTVLDTKTLGSNSPESLGYKLITDGSDRLEILALGITPSSYDDYYYPYGVDRPDVFGDVRTRQAIAFCIDRETIVKNLLQGSSLVTDSILPVDHPALSGVSVTQHSYDPDAGRVLLEAAGWLDLDLNPETPLAHVGNAQIPYATPLSLNLVVSESALQNEIAVEISTDLSACGIEVNIETIPARELYLPGPEGRIFGRNFDLALMTWDTGGKFVCEMLKSSEIPSDANDWLGEVTGGANFYGYANAQFDIECDNLKRVGFDEAARSNSTNYLLKTISDDLPFIPLFHHLDKMMVASNICLPDFVDSENSVFAAIEVAYLSEECE